ncbi:hypothetical protein [Crateriforma conspicua]|uniref:Uncharacterized protein n=1 Tax=Crateriforma conspicua TaxID=2527996 RepID=A0A5C5Y264_9PLAN|nr:hypothetical protein [Crateriforma conspicua]TWT69717.1 hypothetical protein Pan14r_20090 [Crateriforma conspicua]
MVAENKPDTPQICGTPDLCGTREGRIAAARKPAPRFPADRVPGVPQRSQTRGVPRLLQSFGEGPEAEARQEPLSPPEEEARIDDEANDDGPWIINTEAAAELDALEEVDLDDVPVCSCGRYCDVQTLDDAWHCSHCNPEEAEHRRKQTQRLLAAAKRIRKENGLPESNVTQADR